MRLFYTIGIFLYRILIHVAAIGNSKAKKWVVGRKNWKQQVDNINTDKRKVCWIHCASLGEFEQGRPIIEGLKKMYPQIFILLTFYSPSGYEIRKNYEIADKVMYMPVDTNRNARYFLENIHPDFVIFVKYEFWFNFINQLYKQSIPIYSISTIFRKKQLFFKPWGVWFRKHLNMFQHFFVQNEETKKLLKKQGVNQVTISGDTRYDRVQSIASQNTDHFVVRRFSDSKFILVAGSSWPAEHEMLVQLANEFSDIIKIIVAPHELHEKTYTFIENKVNNKVVRLSTSTEQDVVGAQILIVDCIGLLSSLYRYGHVAVIGGGFGKGIHNILEPAVYGVPVLFGPKYTKFNEAVEMVKHNIALPFLNYTELKKHVETLLENKVCLNEKSSLTLQFVKNQLGASQIILNFIRGYLK